MNKSSNSSKCQKLLFLEWPVEADIESEVIPMLLGVETPKEILKSIVGDLKKKINIHLVML